MKETINNLVLRGYVPLTFYNLETKQYNSDVKKDRVGSIFKPYMQSAVSISDSSCLISKIYHAY